MLVRDRETNGRFERAACPTRDELVNDRYRVRHELGRGGMGVVAAADEVAVAVGGGRLDEFGCDFGLR